MVFKKNALFKGIFIFLFSSFLLVQGSNKNKDYLDYINTYQSTAIEMMDKYGIPASIILAQGLLESGAGKSQLAKEANNHFGIKCHSGWTGEYYYYSDDEQNECFRKYKKAKDSFEDYSSYLSNNSKKRYLSLFENFKMENYFLYTKYYITWAEGLQKCGYATDKLYANKLIKLIENYELYQYDTN